MDSFAINTMNPSGEWRGLENKTQGNEVIISGNCLCDICRDFAFFIVSSGIDNKPCWRKTRRARGRQTNAKHESCPLSPLPRPRPFNHRARCRLMNPFPWHYQLARQPSDLRYFRCSLIMQHSKLRVMPQERSVWSLVYQEQHIDLENLNLILEWLK